MPSLKEYFSFRKSCNKANKSDEKCQENNQEQKKICFLCNEEECKDNAKDSVWLQCDKCNFWGNVYCILHTAEQAVTEKMLSCSREPCIC